MNPIEPQVNIFHVPDFYNRYPGEVVSLNTCLELSENPKSYVLEKSSLWVSIPESCELIDFQCSNQDLIESVDVRAIQTGENVVWQLAKLHARDERIEFTVHLRINKPEIDIRISSDAILRDVQGHEITSERLHVQIRLQGEYLNYLPEIYRQDDLMARFLMLFESFWKPIDRQIRQVSYYFDPDLTPEKFLPWLASWVGAYWDETLPAVRRRQMMRMSASLYQRRGTRSALYDFLKIYSDGEVRIIEHPANNLVLGEGTRLGAKTALGTGNSPDTFSVDMKIYKDRFILQNNVDSNRVKEVMQKKILSIIDSQKPAHTICKLNLQVAESHG